MNDLTNTGSSPERPEKPVLPELSQTSIERIEQGVFVDIARERSPERIPLRTKSRRRGWLIGIGVAAAFVAGVLITPPLLHTVGVSSAEGGGSVVGASDTAGSDTGVAESVEAGSSSAVGSEAGGTDREIIANAQATVRVDDIAEGVDDIVALAEERGGYVESTDVTTDPMVTDMTSSSTRMPQPDVEYGWVSIRVPSADLTDVIGALGDEGEIVSSSISKQDVTSTAVDLRARIEASRASVARLTELMSQSGSVSELIEAEVALTDRQAQLEAYEQELAGLEDQVAMSSLQVQLIPVTSATTPEPDGFAAGLLAGWNGLIVSLNALVVTVGFLLPWLVIAGVVFLVIWLIRRRRHHRASAP